MEKLKDIYNRFARFICTGDKAAHCLTCLLIVGLLGKISFPLALLAAAAAALGKEAYDSQQDAGHFDRLDLIADAIGMLLGSILCLI